MRSEVVLEKHTVEKDGGLEGTVNLSKDSSS